MFIIHKNRNKTNIQPILISNSTSFMFNKIFCEVKGKKVIHWGWGNGGTVQIASWKCNFSIYLYIQEYYLDIQAIMTSIGSLCVGSIYSLLFLPYNRSPEKWCFPALKSLLLPVFNQQASDWVHCEEETGAYYQLARNTYKLVNFFKQIFNVYFASKNTRFSKNSIKFIIQFFFQKPVIGHMYICTKCNDNFKFTISLKSYEE